MGHEHSKIRRHPSNLKRTPSDPKNLPLLIREIFYTAQLKKGHKKASQNLKEKDLKAFMDQPSHDIIEQFEKAGTIVNLSKEIQALDLVMQYCDILTDNVPTLNNSAEDVDKIKDLMPYIGSLLFACHKLNIEAGVTLAQLLNEKFSINTFTDKTPEILACFDSTLPSEQEISLYLSQFNQKQTPKPTPSNDSDSQSSSKILKTTAATKASHSQTPRHDGDNQYSPELEESVYGKCSQMTASFPHQSENDRILSESKFSRQIQSCRMNQPDVTMSFGGPKIQKQPNLVSNSSKRQDTMDTEEKSPSGEHESPVMGSPIERQMAVSQSIKMSKYPDLANYSIRSLDMGQESQAMSKQLVDRLNSVRQNL